MVSKHPNLIAELGCVHIGSIERAKHLCNMAIENGADVVKLQKRNPVESVPSSMANMPHPNPHFSYGKTYLEHRLNLELNIDDHAIIKDICLQNNVKYACSVWDITSAKEVIDLCPYFIKIPSACNINFNLIDYVLKNYNNEIHISLGMINREQKENIYNRYGVFPNIVFYHCTSEYPCKFENLYLKEIDLIYKRFGCVGFSNHGYGIAADIAAIALGCSYIERHFIDDRTFRHTDAAASLEPSGLNRLKRDIVNVYKALNYKGDDLTEIEKVEAKKLRA